MFVVFCKDVESCEKDPHYIGKDGMIWHLPTEQTKECQDREQKEEDERQIDKT